MTGVERLFCAPAKSPLKPPQLLRCCSCRAAAAAAPLQPPLFAAAAAACAALRLTRVREHDAEAVTAAALQPGQQLRGVRAVTAKAQRCKNLDACVCKIACFVRVSAACEAGRRVPHTCAQGGSRWRYLQPGDLTSRGGAGDTRQVHPERLAPVGRRHKLCR